MRKFLPFLILFILAILIADAAFDPIHFAYDFDDGDFDGPAGALVAALLAGGGLIIGFVVVVVAVALILAVVFAGVGVVVVGALLLAAAVAALAMIPVLLPILIPVAIIWYLMMRDRKPRQAPKEVAPV